MRQWTYASGYGPVADFERKLCSANSAIVRGPGQGRARWLGEGDAGHPDKVLIWSSGVFCRG